MKLHDNKGFWLCLSEKMKGKGLAWVGAWMLIIFLLSFQLSRTTQADGGAPNLAYVAGSAGGISVIDVFQKNVSKNFAITGDPHAVLLSPDGRYLYVTRPQAGQIAMLAASTGNTICMLDLPGRPEFLALDVITATLYTAGNMDKRITALETTNCQLKRTFQAPAPVNGLALAFAQTNLADGQETQLWATTSRGIAIFNTHTGKTSKVVTLPADQAQTIAIPPGKTAYVTTKGGAISAIDLHTYQTMHLLSGGNYGPMDFDEATGEIYVPDSRHQQLTVLAPVAVGYSRIHEPQRTLHFDAVPNSVAITNDGQLGFVALNNGQVVMLDIPGKQQVTSIHVGGSPHFIITGLYPPLAPIHPQEATFSGILATIISYGLLAVMLIVPTGYFLYRRFARPQKLPHGE
ncbi:hypothetical protein KDW_45680 [Dictyobacter vulcani]|uniref:YncE family protein n=1 Tax=Dictyobacter vulcani TaxID=2607529 RepID=A0A5J4KZ05_9CHLR|nr:hypothetical protein [Dictyobacter vulcani]GER90406.1 hypothetical protein KDW_45680 [Dictyobacter vulcani]